MYIYDVYAFYSPTAKKIFFKFSEYGCWEIDSDLHFSSSSCDVITNDELAIDIIEHRVYSPRVHYFLFYIPSPFPNDLYVIIKYNGSTASVEMFNVLTSLREARKLIRNDSIGLKRRV